MEHIIKKAVMKNQFVSDAKKLIDSLKVLMKEINNPTAKQLINKAKRNIEGLISEFDNQSERDQKNFYNLIKVSVLEKFELKEDVMNLIENDNLENLGNIIKKKYPTLNELIKK